MVISRNKKRNTLDVKITSCTTKPRSTNITTNEEDTPCAVHYQHQFCWSCLFLVVSFANAKQLNARFQDKGGLDESGRLHTHIQYIQLFEHCCSLLSFLSSDLNRFAATIEYYRNGNDQTTRNPYFFPLFFPVIDHDTTLLTPMHINQQK